MKKRYISDEEIAILESLIYNDLNQDLLNSISPVSKNKDTTDTFESIVQGQEYYTVPGKDYLVRKDGAVFNYHFVRQVKPQWTQKDIICIFQRQQFRMSDFYEEAGWEFDHSTITANYIRNGWGIVVPRTYKELWSQLEADLAIY